MIVYVVVGGMKGTTYVQIVKAFMLMIGALLMTLLVLVAYRFNLSEPARRRRGEVRQGRGVPAAGPAVRRGERRQRRPRTLVSKLDLLSLGLALVLGTAGLPHILIRFYTVPNAKAARKSVVWAIGIIGTFYLMTLALGFGAAALVGRQAIAAQDPGGNTAAPQLAEALGERYFGGDFGGAVLLAVIAAVAFATILAVVAGLTLASSSSLAHDLYANVIKRGEIDRAAGGRRRPERRVRHRRGRDRAGHLRPQPQRGVPGGAWRSPSRRRRTCRRSCSRCSGSGSTPGARPGASTAA